MNPDSQNCTHSPWAVAIPNARTKSNRFSPSDPIAPRFWNRCRTIFLVGLLRGAGPLPKANTATVDTVSESPKQISNHEPDDALFRDHPRYRIIRKLGHGGMGIVYLAEHRLMRRLVAIKRIRADTSTDRS